MLLRLIKRQFSSIPKDPILFEDSASGLVKTFYEFIGKPRRSPAYVLSFEVLYHMASDSMTSNFPIIQ